MRKIVILHGRNLIDSPLTKRSKFSSPVVSHTGNMYSLIHEKDILPKSLKSQSNNEKTYYKPKLRDILLYTSVLC